MSIVDEYKAKNVCVQLTHGQIFLTRDFSIEEDKPIRGLLQIKDNTTNEIYWVNFDHFIFIGPA